MALASCAAPAKLFDIRLLYSLLRLFFLFIRFHAVEGGKKRGKKFIVLKQASGEEVEHIVAHKKVSNKRELYLVFNKRAAAEAKEVENGKVFQFFSPLFPFFPCCRS